VWELTETRGKPRDLLIRAFGQQNEIYISIFVPNFKTTVSDFVFSWFPQKRIYSGIPEISKTKLLERCRWEAFVE
jgi:hypothetical protein